MQINIPIKISNEHQCDYHIGYIYFELTESLSFSLIGTGDINLDNLSSIIARKLKLLGEYCSSRQLGKQRGAFQILFTDEQNEEQLLDHLTDTTHSAILGLFLTYLKETTGQNLKNKWSSITATGDLEYIPDSETLNLVEVKKIKEKFECLCKYIQSQSNNNNIEKHLFLYISDTSYDFEFDEIKQKFEYNLNNQIEIIQISTTSSLYKIEEIIFESQVFRDSDLLEDDYNNNITLMNRLKKIMPLEYYPTEDYNKIIHTVRHLGDYWRMFFITGAVGMGKTTTTAFLLTYLLKKQITKKIHWVDLNIEKNASSKIVKSKIREISDSLSFTTDILNTTLIFNLGYFSMNTFSDVMENLLNLSNQARLIITAPMNYWGTALNNKYFFKFNLSGLSTPMVIEQFFKLKSNKYDRTPDNVEFTNELNIFYSDLLSITRGNPGMLICFISLTDKYALKKLCKEVSLRRILFVDEQLNDSLRTFYIDLVNIKLYIKPFKKKSALLISDIILFISTYRLSISDDKFEDFVSEAKVICRQKTILGMFDKLFTHYSEELIRPLLAYHLVTTVEAENKNYYIVPEALLSLVFKKNFPSHIKSSRLRFCFKYFRNQLINSKYSLIDAIRAESHSSVPLLILHSGYKLNRKCSSIGFYLVNSIVNDSNDARLMESILDLGYDLFTDDLSGYPLIYTLMGAGKLDILSFCIEHGVSLSSEFEVPGFDVLNLLQLACTFPKTINIITYLIQQKMDINKQTPKYKLSPLHLAAKNENNDNMLVLLDEESIDIDIVNIDGETPLLYAAENRRWDNVKLLKNRGANIDIRSNNGHHLIHKIAKSGDLDAFKILNKKELESCINFKDIHSFTPLLTAVSYVEEKNFFEFLLKINSIDVNIDLAEATAVTFAAMNNNKNAVKVLSEDIRVDLNKVDRCKKASPVEWAIVLNNFDIADILIAGGVCFKPDSLIEYLQKTKKELSFPKILKRKDLPPLSRKQTIKAISYCKDINNKKL